VRNWTVLDTLDRNPLAELPGNHGELSPEADAAWADIEEEDCRRRNADQPPESIQQRLETALRRSLTNEQRAVAVSKQLRRIERRRRELAARKIAAMSLREQWDLACAIGAAQFRLRQRATVEA